MINNYLQILQESLCKKNEILFLIEQKSREQLEMIKSDKFTLEDIDKNMDEKADLINRMTQLDKGFDALYTNVRKELLKDKEQYKKEIVLIQSLISRIMEKSTSIETIEMRNKASMEERLKIERRDLKQKKNISSIAYNYYQTTNKINFVTPQFMDKKK